MRSTSHEAGMLRCTRTTRIDSEDRAPFFDEFSVTRAGGAEWPVGATRCVLLADASGTCTPAGMRTQPQAATGMRAPCDGIADVGVLHARSVHNHVCDALALMRAQATHVSIRFYATPSAWPFLAQAGC